VSEGRHRPEAVFTRRVAERLADLVRIAAKEALVSADFDTVLAELDSVVEMVSVHRSEVLADATDQVAQRVSALKSALGIDDSPAAEPTASAEPVAEPLPADGDPVALPPMTNGAHEAPLSSWPATP
jgi:hypothetical protein